MKLQVRNFLGIQSADIELPKGMALVGGNNAKGKSSAAHAFGCALTGKALPFPWMKKSQAQELVRDGASSALVAVESDEGSRKISYPKDLDPVSKGDPPVASDYATGRTKFSRHDKKGRSEILIDVLKSHPTYNDLKAELEAKQVPVELIDEVFKVIRAFTDVQLESWIKEEIDWKTQPGREDWDVALAKAQDRGKRLKGQYREATGRNHGKNIAESWLPDHWEVDLEESKLETLQEDVRREREWLKSAIASNAITAHERDQCAARVNSLPDLEKRKQEAKNAVAALDEQVNAMKRQISELRDPGKPDETISCPHCEMPIVVEEGKARKPSDKAPTKEEKEEYATRYKELADNLSLLELEKQRLDNSNAALALEIEAAQRAKKKLEEPVGEGTPEEQIDEHKEFLERAERRAKAFLQKQRADKIHNDILQNQEIINTLKPEGLQARLLKQKLSEFCAEVLKPLSQMAGWGAVDIDDELMPTFNGRRYDMVSASERARINITLQIAFAQLDKSHAVVIDAADIFDSFNRQNLFELLYQVKIPAVIFMTENDPSDLPNLEEAGLGFTYWIKDGICERVASEQEVAA